MRRAALLLVLVLQATMALAEETTAQQAYQLGIEAFRAGNPRLAATHLEAARAAGLSRATLFYNLGVAYYRLEQYDQARGAFQQLLNSPHGPLARYNLGLVALAESRPAVAEAEFRRVLAEAAEEKLVRLARRQLERLEQPAVPEKAERSLQAFASLSAVYDGNITRAADNGSSERDGMGLEALVALAGHAWGDRQQGLRLAGSYYELDYPNNRDFSQQAGQWQLGWQNRLAGLGWWELTGEQQWLWEDRDRVERRDGVSIAWEPPTCLVADWWCRGRLKTQWVDPGSGFEPYDGERHEARWVMGYSASAWRAQGAYRLVLDDRDDLGLGDEFFSLSAWRHWLESRLGYAITPRWNLSADLGVRYSRYRDAHRQLDAGSLVTERRKDWLTELGLGATYQWSTVLSLFIEATFEDNRSTLERYDYDRSQLSLGVSARY